MDGPIVMLGTKWLGEIASMSAAECTVQYQRLDPLPVHDICRATVSGGSQSEFRDYVPMCSHSAPPSIMRLHSAESCPKSEARTEGAMMG